MSLERTTVTASLIIIGNEILSGRTTDANLPYLAKALGEIGIRLTEARVVSDDEVEIVGAVNACRSKYDYVFTTGGIGPTHDDITAACVAKAFGRSYGRNTEAEARLLAYYPPEKVNDARMSMADMPDGVTLIDNPVSIAPGFRIENVFVMAGVPKIMQAMLDNILPTLQGCRARSRFSCRKANLLSLLRICRHAIPASRSAAILFLEHADQVRPSFFAAWN